MFRRGSFGQRYNAGEYCILVQLAGLGSRFLAVAIDFAIQIVLTVLILIALVLSEGGFQPRRVTADPLGSSFAVALVAIVTFLIFFGYFILFEAFWHGRTPGKWMMGLRVVRDGGYPMEFGAAAIRNLVRVAEVAFGAYALSAAACLLSPLNKRLGDMAAGTIVVRDSRIATLAAIVEESGQERPRLMLSEQEYALVDRYAARRAGLAPEVRGLLAARIAHQIRPKVSADIQRLDDDELLVRVSAW